MDLALFDFDGTITIKGTYPGFIQFAVPRSRKVIGGIILGPLILGYRCGLVSDRAIRKPMSSVAFWRDEAARIRALGQRYAAEALPGMVRPVALERIAWHKARGDHVVVVSASLDVYLEPWCRTLGVDVICTQLEVKAERLTGRYLGGDCCEGEKVRRITERYRLGDYAAVHAYGDTEDDREMLDIASRKYFRWEEVRGIPMANRATRRGDGGV